MASISFDRAADYYDATRGYASGTAERLRAAIRAATGATRDTRFLELGVGTGRVAAPFLRAGETYLGVDISSMMLRQLVRNLTAHGAEATARSRLVQGDVMRLPFADAVFDIVIAVHVFHLIPDRRLALHEAWRVLRRPGGQLLAGYDEAPDEGDGERRTFSPARLVREKWNSILLELRGEDSRPKRWGKIGEQIADDLRALGATVETIALVDHHWPPLSARAMAQRLTSRMYSSDWSTPVEIHAEASRRLEDWLNTECPTPDLPIAAPGRFMAVRAQAVSKPAGTENQEPRTTALQ
jgi:SAM-dependent methyltransferase